jgi:hypothetical protein
MRNIVKLQQILKLGLSNRYSSTLWMMKMGILRPHRRSSSSGITSYLTPTLPKSACSPRTLSGFVSLQLLMMLYTSMPFFPWPTVPLLVKKLSTANVQCVSWQKLVVELQHSLP